MTCALCGSSWFWFVSRADGLRAGMATSNPRRPQLAQMGDSPAQMGDLRGTSSLS
jgi:hypothetical protein